MNGSDGLVSRDGRGEGRGELARFVAVVGATATGKTDFAIRLARAVGGEIINCDSMQVYEGMDVGTAKPDPVERASVPHHLLDVVRPDQVFTAASFRTRAAKAIQEISGRGRVPVVVGGTGLYLRALIYGLSPAPGRDEALRRELTGEGEQVGWEVLHARLMQVDPDTARRVAPRDKSRIIRGLEVFQLTGGIPLSEINRRHGFSKKHYRTLIFGMDVPRPLLRDRIEARLDQMLAGGFVEEVEGLLTLGYSPELKAMQSLGYKEICQVLAGELEMDPARERIFFNTCRYAKRQETWFKKMDGVEWVAPGEEGVAEACARQVREFMGLKG